MPFDIPDVWRHEDWEEKPVDKKMSQRAEDFNPKVDLPRLRRIDKLRQHPNFFRRSYAIDLVKEAEAITYRHINWIRKGLKEDAQRRLDSPKGF